MADHMPPDGVPTWAVAIISVISTIGGWKALSPLARWAGKRFDAIQLARAAERGDFLSQTLTELQSAREEMVEIRQDLGEEKELRMALAIDNAMLTERVEGLTKAMAEDKRDCQKAIKALQNEIRELRKQYGQPS